MPQLEFKGKHNIYAHHLVTPYRELIPDNSKSLLPANQQPSQDGNLIIHGDNLHALKALLPRYAGRVNCIYIDPPYNTGNEQWCYNDNVNSPLMQRWITENGAVEREDPERHDKWLCMLWPRLHLLRELLAEDGVIFISIDDNEQHHLRMIMDEIFGEENYLNYFVWVNNLKGRQISKSGAAATHEFILAYTKDIERVQSWNPIAIKKARDLMPDSYKMQEYEIMRDKIGEFVIKNELHNTNSEFNEKTRPNLVFKIHYNSKTEEIRFTDAHDNTTYDGFTVIPPKNINGSGHRFHAWRWSREKIIAESHGLYFEKRDNEYRIYTKIRDFGVTNLKDIITNINGGNSVLKALKIDFPNSKPTDLIKLLVDTVSSKNALILDSFAGSGTTAQAVLELNQEDGGNRRFILVECEDYANSITAERVRRVIRGVPSAKNHRLQKGLGGHFTYCTLGNEISAHAMLFENKLPTYEALARYVVYTAIGTPATDVHQRNNWLCWEDDRYAIYLIYKPDQAFMLSKASKLTFEMAEQIHRTHKSKKSVLVFADGKYMSQKDITKFNITFCQLPWAIHRVAG